ncbi:MAG: DUF4254 domain-containing protein [Mariniblastus sp.]|nr:DUF4254 domain-containing protein [Mariniblastus sp.]
MSDVCKQHSFNFQLWHEEDIARSPDADDAVIARVKRAIDGFNQQRNDWIETVDDHLARMIEEEQVQVDETARINTETPGSVIDRLSILALRIYHLKEQLERTNVDEDHFEKVRRRIAVCLFQQDELSQELALLLNDMFAGRIRHRTYRQLKMYNDSTLNPYLYDRQQEVA